MTDQFTQSTIPQLEPWEYDVPIEVAPVRAGEELPWDRLAAYLAAVLDVSGDLTVMQFPNGSANLTYLLDFGGRRFVLRRPPFGVIAPGAHDMKREFRVLSRLWREYDRAPRAFVLCDDHDVVGSDFVVSEYRTRRGRLGQRPAVDGRPARRRPPPRPGHRRRPRRPPPGRSGGLRPGRPRPARRLHPAPAGRLARAMGARRHARSRSGDVVGPGRAGAGDPHRLAGHVPPQRLQARQLPVQPRAARSSDERVRLGHGHAR